MVAGISKAEQMGGDDTTNSTFKQRYCHIICFGDVTGRLWGKRILWQGKRLENYLLDERGKCLVRWLLKTAQHHTTQLSYSEAVPKGLRSNPGPGPSAQTWGSSSNRPGHHGLKREQLGNRYPESPIPNPASWIFSRLMEYSFSISAFL